MSVDKLANTTVSWRSNCKITKYIHTWTIENFSFCRSGLIASSKYDPLGNGMLVWLYRLDPYNVYNMQYHVRLDLMVESCEVPVQFIVKTTVHNTQLSKTCVEKAVKVEKATDINCMLFLRDSFFSVNQITFSFEILIVEKYKCQEAPHMNIIQPQSKLLEDFAHLFGDLEFSDVKFVVGEREFLGHKAILAVRSAVFRAMFKSEMIESKQNQVTITDVEPEVFAELLRYIYTDSVQGLNEMALDLLRAADKYDLAKLKAMCEKAACANISEKTAVQMLITADLYRADQLKRATVGFIERNASVLNSEEWKGLWTTNFELANQTVSEMLKLKK